MHTDNYILSQHPPINNIPQYSRLDPETNSLSASPRSNGTLPDSTNHTTYQMVIAHEVFAHPAVWAPTDTDPQSTPIPHYLSPCKGATHQLKRY